MDPNEMQLHVKLESDVDFFIEELRRENDPKLGALYDGRITIDELRYFGAYVTLIGFQMHVAAEERQMNIMDIDYDSITAAVLDQFCVYYRQERSSVESNIERIRSILLEYDPMIRQSPN